MKFSKTSALDFFKKCTANGTINEFVIEEDGSVDIMLGTSMAIFGKMAEFPGFGKRVGITNPAQLTKFINALDSADNQINAEIAGNDIVLATRAAKYGYRLADADTIQSFASKEEHFRSRLAEYENKITLTIDQVDAIKKAITLLCKTDEKSIDCVELFADGGLLQAIVRDDATKSSSTIDLASSVQGNFKTPFLARNIQAILQNVTAAGATMYIDAEKPMYVELGDKSFLYLLSQVLTQGA